MDLLKLQAGMLGIFAPEPISFQGVFWISPGSFAYNFRNALVVCEVTVLFKWTCLALVEFGKGFFSQPGERILRSAKLPVPA